MLQSINSPESPISNPVFMCRHLLVDGRVGHGAVLGDLSRHLVLHQDGLDSDLLAGPVVPPEIK